MNTMSFQTSQELVAYVTAQGIAQSKIVDIEWKDGRWHLFWYT